MATGKGVLTQVGGRGCFARVRLEVNSAEGPFRFEVAEGLRADPLFLPGYETKF
jgi:hypothetical protein